MTIKTTWPPLSFIALFRVKQEQGCGTSTLQCPRKDVEYTLVPLSWRLENASIVPTTKPSLHHCQSVCLPISLGFLIALRRAGALCVFLILAATLVLDMVERVPSAVLGRGVRRQCHPGHGIGPAC